MNAQKSKAKPLKVSTLIIKYLDTDDGNNPPYIVLGLTMNELMSSKFIVMMET